MSLGNIDTEKEFGVYQPLSQLSSHGDNRVHLAQSTVPPWQMVVIKVYMKRRLRLQPHNEREAFLQEAQSLCQLKHPHLLSVIDVGFRDGWPYMIMKHATGRSLRQRLDRQVSTLLPTEEILRLIEQISQALDYLHQQQIVHGNVKPENILFTEHDQVLLSDVDPMAFSEDSSSTDLALHSTSPYTAPEQITGQRSSQSDQYALGCVAYELFTGRPAFSPSDSSLQHNFSTETVVSPTQINPSLSQLIEQIILKAIAKDVNDRYESVLQFNQALHVAVGLSAASSSATTETQIQEEGLAPSPTFLEDAMLPVEDSGYHETHEESPIALHSKLLPSMTQNQTSQKRGARTTTAVQIWLVFACLGTVLGATSEISHIFSWQNNPLQQLGTTARRAGQQIVPSPQVTFSSLVPHPSPTAIPTPTATPTPSPTPTRAPTPTPPPVPTVADAGFETPWLGHAGYQYGPTGSRWTFSNGGGIAANGSAFTSNNPNAPQGTQVAFLQETGLIRQTISFAAGNYQISFSAAQRKGVNKSVQNFRLWIDGQVVGTFTPSGFKYKRYSTGSFTVSAGNHVLSFQGLDSNSGDNTAFIDAVAIL
jgi:serine/threonine protein kinase